MRKTFDIFICVCVGFVGGLVSPVMADTVPDATPNTIGVLNDTDTPFRCRAMMQDDELSEYQDLAPGDNFGIDAGSEGYKAVKCTGLDEMGSELWYCFDGSQTFTMPNCEVGNEDTGWLIYTEQLSSGQTRSAMVVSLGVEIPEPPENAVIQGSDGAPSLTISVDNETEITFRCRLVLPDNEYGSYEDIEAGGSAELQDVGDGFKTLRCVGQDAGGTLLLGCADGSRAFSEATCEAGTEDAQWRLYTEELSSGQTRSTIEKL